MLKLSNHYQLKNGERTIDVPRGKAFIGSSTVCAITLPEGDAQDFHAMLYWREESLFILDLKSPQGTYLNGGIISETQVFDGHELTIGTLSFLVNVTSTQTEVAESATIAE